jgi:ribosomal protein S18 acetylase RimI-like enzyme
MDQDLAIRLATAADAPAFVELYGVLYESDGRLRDPALSPGWAEAHGAAYFGAALAGPSSAGFLAEAGGQSVGYLLARLYPADAFRAATVAELESMAVRPEWRRRGVGRALARAFVAWAHQRQASHLRVTAYAGNQAAIAFYQRLGFAPHQVTLEREL